LQNFISSLWLEPHCGQNIRTLLSSRRLKYDRGAAEVSSRGADEKARGLPQKTARP
jgi:hypothetical protein